MIIQCEQCKTRFKLDESRVKETGVRVRCSKCKHTFIVKKEVSEEEPDFDVMLQSFGGLPSDEKPESKTSVSETTKELPSFQGSEDSYSAEDAKSGGIAGTNECRMEIEPGSTMEDLGSGQSGAGGSDAVDFNFDDFAGDEQSIEQKPVPEFSAEDKTGCDLEPAVDPQKSVDIHTWDFISPEQSGIESEFFTDMNESNQESCREIQQDEQVFVSGIKEEKEAEVLSAESDKAENPESGDGKIDKELFAAGKAWPDEDLPVIAAALDGEQCVKDDSEFSTTAAISGIHGAEARPFRSFDGVEDDELPPLSIASRRKGFSMASVTMIAVTLTIVFALAVTGYFLLNGYSAESVLQSSGLSNLFGLNKATGGELTVKNSEGSFHANNDLGEFFVVKGEVFNNSKVPRNSPQVKGLVYGPKGKVLLEQTVKCGTILSNEQLAVFSKVAVEKSLNPPSGSSYGGQVLQPGKGIPFMIVFSNVPQGAEEFGVEVLGSPGASR